MKCFITWSSGLDIIITKRKKKKQFNRINNIFFDNKSLFTRLFKMAFLIIKLGDMGILYPLGHSFGRLQPGEK